MLSFVVPAYNEEMLIGSCLKSIINEIKLTNLDCELIVVDNGSTDQTAKVARNFSEVTVVSEVRRGLSYARMRGFLASRGYLIANIDADNMLTDGWIAKVVAEFERIPDLVAVSGPLVYYDLSRIARFWVRIFYYLNYVLYLINRDLLKIGSFLQGVNFVVKRDALERIGGYSPSFPFYGEDTDVARRLHQEGVVRFSWSLSLHSSGRRLVKEGMVRVGMRYALNLVWAMYLRRPFTQGWTNVRVGRSLDRRGH